MLIQIKTKNYEQDALYSSRWVYILWTRYLMVTSHPVFAQLLFTHTQKGRTEMKNRKPTQEPSHNQNISEWINHFLPARHFVSSFLDSLRDNTERSKSSCPGFGSNVSPTKRSIHFFFFIKFCLVNKHSKPQRRQFSDWRKLKKTPTCLVCHACTIPGFALSTPHLHTTLIKINPERPCLWAASSLLLSWLQSPVCTSFLLLSFQMATEWNLSEKCIHAVNVINDTAAMFRFGAQ